MSATGGLQNSTLRWLLAVSALAGPQGACAADEFLSLHRYGLDEGLSQTSVAALAEDDQGLLWVGTQEGLNRFDGQRFSVLRRQPGDSTGIASSSIDSLSADARSRLWVGTNDAGLEVLDLRDGRRWRLGVEQGLSHPTVSKLLPDAAGGAWLGTPRGIDRVDAALDRVHSLQRGAAIVALQREGANGLALDERCTLYRLDTTGAEVETRSPGIPEAARCSGLAVEAGSRWLATRQHGLFRVDRTGALQQAWPPPALIKNPSPLNTLFQRRDGSLLLGFADGRLASIGSNGHAESREVQLDRPLGSAVNGFFEHSSGVLWVGTHSAGLFRARALSGALRTEGIGERELAGWRNRNVYALWRDAGRWLVGTETGLMTRLGEGPWEAVEGVGSSAVRRILARPGGHWLLGTHDGLWQLDTDFTARRIDGDYHPQVSDLLDTGDGVWVATRDGLYRLHEGVISQQGVPAELRRGFLTTLLRDSDGSLWVGSNEQGVWRLADGGGLQRHHQGRGTLVHDSVWALHADADAIWAGTFSGGLQRIPRDGSAGRVYGEREGLSNNVVYRIERDAGGRLWLSTNRGLSVLDPASGLVQVLLRSDGLSNQEFNAGASFTGADGLLHFGGVDGIDVLDPRLLPVHSGAAVPMVGELEVLGRRGVAGSAAPAGPLSVRYRDRIELDWRDSVIALDMVALDFTAPDTARLRYRLHGVADHWVYPASPRTELLLSYLPGGNYQLEVAAAGRDGRFGAARRFDIVLPPPPWLRPWAFAAYLLLVIALLAVLARRIRVREGEKQAQIDLLNRTVADRTAALEEANRLLRASNAQLDIAGRTDPLTKVSNRRDLQAWLPQAAVEGRGLLFCMVDIDDFKLINDSRGHQIGDEVLVRFAERLRRLCRDRDILVRWGGEEFLLVLRDTRADDAPALMERLRRSVADTPIALDDGGSVPATCSVGFARWPFAARWPETGDWEQSVALADRALYRAKRAGKNAWCGWLEGEALDPEQLEMLLTGTAPEQLRPGAITEQSGPAATPSRSATTQPA